MGMNYFSRYKFRLKTFTFFKVWAVHRVTADKIKGGFL